MLFLCSWPSVLPAKLFFRAEVAPGDGPLTTTQTEERVSLGYTHIIKGKIMLVEMGYFVIIVT